MTQGKPNAHVQKRMQKVNSIIATCKAAFASDLEDTGVIEEKIISLICLEYGSGRRYVKEIIKDLVNVGKIQSVNKKLYYVESGH